MAETGTLLRRHDKWKVNVRFDDQVYVIGEGEQGNVRDDLLYFLIRAACGFHRLEVFSRHSAALALVDGCLSLRMVYGQGRRIALVKPAKLLLAAR